MVGSQFPELPTDIFNEPKSDCALKIVGLNHDGDLAAYINAIRTAYSSWHIGGIVSKLNDKQLTKNFIKSFFKLLLDLNSACGEFSSFSISWKIKHPFWVEYERFLVSSECDSIWRGTVLRYSFSALKLETENAIRLIKKDNLQIDSRYDGLRKSLGFSGEPDRIAWTLGEENVNLERQTFEVYQGDRLLGILLAVKSSHSLGVHRNTEAVWFFDSTHSDGTSLSYQNSIGIGLRLAQLGIRPPSLITPGSAVPEDGKLKVAPMNYYVHGPRAIKWYIDNC